MARSSEEYRGHLCMVLRCSAWLFFSGQSSDVGGLVSDTIDVLGADERCLTDALLAEDCIFGHDPDVREARRPYTLIEIALIIEEGGWRPA